MAWITAAFALLAASIPTAAGGAEVQARAAPPFRRGASVHELLNWGDLRSGDARRYVDAPFSGPTHEVPDAVLRNAARAGFDFVRLTVDPGPFLQLTGVPRAGLDATLAADVARLRRFGFSVLVDLHPVEQVPLYGGALMTPGARPGFEEYRGLVARMARLLGGLRTRSVALELMNEPGGFDPESEARWQGQVEGLHAAARSAAPDLLLVISGADGGGLDGLLHLDTKAFAGSNVMYTFHYYEPHAFTHQGVSGTLEDGGFLRFLTGLPYPSSMPFDPKRVVADNFAASAGADPDATAEADQARQAAVAYAAGGFDRARVRHAFDSISAWAAARGIAGDRILLGEFGATRRSAEHEGADLLSALAWLRDVRGEAETHGFAWAIWALRGSAMQVVTKDEGTTLDPDVLGALGLDDLEHVHR